MAALPNTSRRALIVEGEPAIREIVRPHLSLARFEAEEVSDGHAAPNDPEMRLTAWGVGYRFADA